MVVSAEATEGDRTQDAIALVSAASAEMRGQGRTDLERRLIVSAARISRPATVVCVVGEFKAGKSSLINAMLGVTVCPVDDDLATSVITLLHFADEPAVRVRRQEGGRGIVESVDPSQLTDFIGEAGNPENRLGIERVEIGLPNALLRDGLTLVDTPGAGGLGAGYAAATLAFLPYVDGLIFATDASSELSATELDFLREATERCPSVLCALTKVDISPDWSQIAELDRGHLDRAGLRVELLPVSSKLRGLAVDQRDRELNVESGFPALVQRLDTSVIRPAKSVAVDRAIADVRAIMAQLTPALRTELASLEDPSATAETVASLQAAQAHLEHLRGPGSRWSQLVGDRMTELANAANYGFRGSLRTVTQVMDERIEELKTPAEWEDLGRRLSSAVADAVAAVFATIEDGSARLRRDVVTLLREDSIELAESDARRVPLDVVAMWTNPAIEEARNRAGATMGQALTGLRGAQSGILMLGMLGTLMPAAAGALLLSTPITLGLGLAFAGGQLLDANRRKVAARRQKARAAVRQFLDDVGFEVGNQLGEALREIQRQIRDEFTERVTELHRTYADAAQRAEQDVRRGDAERDQRATETRAALERLERIDRTAASLAGG